MNTDISEEELKYMGIIKNDITPIEMEDLNRRVTELIKLMEEAKEKAKNSTLKFGENN